MSKVLIIGAGASFGHGYCDEAVHRPPLVNGFFGHPQSAALKGDYKDLFSYLQDTFSSDMETLEGTDLEKLIGHLEPLWGLNVVGRTQNARYGDFKYDEQFEPATPFELLRAFIADVIYLSTEWLSTAECPYHDRLVRSWLAEGDTVISFNYDLILDASLRKHSIWREETGYGWNAKDRPDGYVVEDWSEREREYVHAGIRLLKLHGSLNFSRCLRYRSKQPYTQLYPFFFDKKVEKPEVQEYESVAVIPLSAFWTIFRPRYLPSMCRAYSEDFDRPVRELIQIGKYANQGKSAYEMGALPLMIVPTPYKPFHEMVFGELRDTWQQAFESLSKAEKALSCGYSFRDEHFNQIIREATRKRDEPLDLTIVDPSIGALDEIDKRLSPCRLRITPIAKNLADFVKTLD